jgi:hypothetical protein
MYRRKKRRTAEEAVKRKDFERDSRRRSEKSSTKKYPSLGRYSKMIINSKIYFILSQ